MKIILTILFICTYATTYLVNDRRKVLGIKLLYLPFVLTTLTALIEASYVKGIPYGSLTLLLFVVFSFFWFGKDRCKSNP